MPGEWLDVRLAPTDRRRVSQDEADSLVGNHPSAEGRYSDRFSFRRSLIVEQRRRICVALGSINDEKCAGFITEAAATSNAATAPSWCENLSRLRDFAIVSHA